MQLTCETIGETWLSVAARILRSGQPGRWGDLPFRELVLVTLTTTRPDPHDSLISAHADPERLVELADLQHRVATDLGAGVGALTMTVKSAHVYDTELDLMGGIVRAIESQT